MIGVSEAALRDKSNVFGDILDTIFDEDWLDGLVDHPRKKEKVLRGLVSMVKGLKESQHASSNFDDRSIGTIIVAIEKKKAAENLRKERHSEATDGDAREEVATLRRKKEKKRKDVGKSGSPDLRVGIPCRVASDKGSEKIKKSTRRT